MKSISIKVSDIQEHIVECKRGASKKRKRQLFTFVQELVFILGSTYDGKYFGALASDEKFIRLMKRLKREIRK